MMPVVYLAGPYRSAHGEFFVRRNIRLAEKTALKLWRMGCAVVCPHKNTAGFGGYLPDAVWLRGDLAMIDVCNAVVMMPAWTTSAGAEAEHEYALGKGKKVFYWPRDRQRIAEFIASS